MTAPALAIVLAAGKGTRMKSDTPKVLHEIAGRSMLAHVLATVHAAGDMQAAVVVGTGADVVRAEANAADPQATTHLQENQLGTGDAVLAARSAIAAHAGPVFVLFGDTPLVRPETLVAMRGALDEGANVVVLGFEAADPTGYGRLLRDAAGELLAIREDRDCSASERGVRLCNSGVMGFNCPDLLGLLDRISNDNAKGEYYLTDAVELARADGLSVRVTVCPEDEVLGINSRMQLAQAEAVFQKRAREAAMAGGATLIAPETVWFSHDTVLGRDIVIEPNVFFGPGVRVGDRVLIRANSHLEGARLADGVTIGPFARLRPGADLGNDVRVGNFVEVKNVRMARGAKANHLSYLGDGEVGVGANIGAGTIFCNYDGFNKSRTIIEDGAFIGSNSALVAPVTIGAGAYVGSGSVITKSVPADALALERNQQSLREGWASRFREMMAKRKAR